jgi:hypothetical protein
MAKALAIRLKRLLITCSAVSVLLLITGWILFQRIPSWYRPVWLGPDDIESVQRDFSRKTEELNSRIGRAAPGAFEWTISDDQVNAWFSAREDMWPDSRNWLPPNMSDVCVRFEPDGIRLAATVSHSRIETVLSAHFAVGIDDGDLRLRLAGVSGGSLPFPAFAFRDLITELDQRISHEDMLKYSYESTELPRLTDLFTEMRLPDEWVWWNGTRPFRIVALKLEEGVCTATLEPIVEAPPAARRADRAASSG